MLGPGAFALYTGDGSEYVPSDLIARKTWSHIMSLPDDVALQTSSHLGSVIDVMNRLHLAWLDATWHLDNAKSPFMAQASMLAHEEYEALVFNVLHGYYRQGIACLRNAFELLAHAAAFAKRGDKQALNSWLRGDYEPEVGDSLKTLHDSDTGRRLREAGSDFSIFGAKGTDNAWGRHLYRSLCGPAHSRAGSNSLYFWEGSNGPVYNARAVGAARDHFFEL